MSLHVQDLVGAKWTVEMEGLKTVHDLKKVLEQLVVDMPTEQQRLTLIRNDQRLQPDTAQLSDLGVQAGDQLELQVLSWTEAQGL
mmetsp:Transcript_59488/g.72818  ORF Transcript_59488/g.72818 Transcript_59488/m.72818 type:complete len:85 (+) Transcript_59488:61-315(+)